MQSKNQLVKLKRLPQYPNHKILVTGCASQIDEKSFINLKNVKKSLIIKQKLDLTII